MPREPAPVEPAEGVDLPDRGHVERPSDPDQAEGSLQAGDDPDRVRSRASDEADAVAGVIGRGRGGHPEASLRIEGEGRHRGQSRRVDGRPKSTRPPQARPDRYEPRIGLRSSGLLRGAAAGRATAARAQENDQGGDEQAQAHADLRSRLFAEHHATATPVSAPGVAVAPVAGPVPTCSGSSRSGSSRAPDSEPSSRSSSRSSRRSTGSSKRSSSRMSSRWLRHWRLPCRRLRGRPASSHQGEPESMLHGRSPPLRCTVVMSPVNRRVCDAPVTARRSPCEGAERTARPAWQGGARSGRAEGARPRRIRRGRRPRHSPRRAVERAGCAPGLRP